LIFTLPFAYPEQMMAPGRILDIFARKEVDCLLIGGMNFYLRHRPVSTFDVDFWICDDQANRERVAAALIALDAQWGATEETWAPVSPDAGWLTRQSVYCLTSPAGAIDIFRTVDGLMDYDTCKARSTLCRNSEGTPYRSLSDADMLACQMVLPEGERRLDRVAYFKKLLES
jgi:hypothetical protein